MEIYKFVVVLVVVVLPQCHGLKECKGTDALISELNDATRRAATWLTEFLEREQAQDDVHIDSAAFHSLRLAGFDLRTDALVQNNTFRRDGGKLGLHVDRIIASCQKPSKKVIKRLRHCTETSTVKCGLTHSFQYLTAVLALCNSGHSFSGGPKNEAVKRIKQILNTHFTKSLDTFALAIITQSCVDKRICQLRKQALCPNNINKNTVQLLLNEQNKLDGSFGRNAITTALAVQALLTQRVSGDQWQCSKTMRYLLNRQKPDGSLGGLMATIQILPVLKGASLSDHDRLEQRCKNIKQRNQRGRIAVHNNIGSQMLTTPSTTTATTTSSKITVSDIKDRKVSTMDVQNVTVKLVVNVTGKFECHYDVIVRNGSSAIDVLQSPEKNYTCCDEYYCDQEVSFRAITNRYGPYIQAIGRYEENIDKNLHWMMYTDDDTLATVGVDSYYPRNATRLTFRFESTD